MILQPGATTKGRSLAAALLGVLAVLASLFVGPAAARAQTVGAPAATTLTVRSGAPLAFGLRETRHHLRVPSRRGTGEQPRLALAIERPATAGQDPTPFAVLGAPVLVVPLVAGFRAFRDQSGQVSCRTSGTRRDRAPPAFAFV